MSEDSLAAGSILLTAFRPLSRLQAYAATCGFVGLALGLSLLLEERFGGPFWLLFPAAALASTWFGGLAPGWLATASSAVLAAYFFIPPRYSFAINLRDLPMFVTFVSFEILSIWIVDKRRLYEETLQKANAALKQRELAEQALQQTRAELAHAAQLNRLNELAAQMAHRIVQPLAAVVANVDAAIGWLSNGRSDLVQARRAAERAALAASRATDLVNQTKLMMPPTRTPTESITAQCLIESVVLLWEEQSASKQITVQVNVAADLPELIVNVPQMQQAILSLLLLLAESAALNRLRDVGIMINGELNQRRSKPELLVRLSAQRTGSNAQTSLPGNASAWVKLREKQDAITALVEANDSMIEGQVDTSEPWFQLNFSRSIS